MNLHGEYLFWLPKPPAQLWRNRIESPDFIIPNIITDEGKDEFFKAIFQDVFDIAGGANFYIGFCNQAPNATDVLTDINTEPTVSNGYARQAVIRSAVGWPTLGTINNNRYIQSAAVTFTASGGAFSAAYSRLFLTDASAGSAGKLYSVSGPLTTAVTVPDGQSAQAAYRISFA